MTNYLILWRATVGQYIESYQNKYCRLSRLSSDCMIIPVWETVRESGDQEALSTLPPASYHQTSLNFGKSHEHNKWYRSPTHVSLTPPLPFIPTLSILHLINSQLFSPFPPLEISSPCHRKCPSTTRSLVPLLPYRYHWVASTRRHHQSHPVPDSPSRAVARKLGTKRIGLWMFLSGSVTPKKQGMA